MSATAAMPIDAGAPGATPGTSRARALDGERLAFATTAAAVALLPLLRPGGPGNVAPVDLLIGPAVAACLLWAGMCGHRWRFPYAMAMALFIAGGALGALAGPVPQAGAVAVVQDVVLVAWCWAVTNIASSPQRLGVLLATWAYSAIAWAVLLFIGVAGHLSILTGQAAREGSRTSLTFLDPNYSASYYVVSIMIIWASGRPRRRWLRIAGYVLLVAALASSGSNSGVLSLLLGTSVAAVVGVYRRHGMPPAIVLFSVLVLAGFWLGSQVSLASVQRAARGSGVAFLRDGIGRGEASVAQRGTLLHESVRLYHEGGLLGEGPVSTKVRLHEEMAPFTKEAHDDYLAALIERGALGFVGFLTLLATVVWRTSQLAARRLSASFTAAVPRPNALVGAVAGATAAMAVNELLHVRHVWTLFAFVAAMHAWGVRR